MIRYSALTLGHVKEIKNKLIVGVVEVVEVAEVAAVAAVIVETAVYLSTNGCKGVYSFVLLSMVQLKTDNTQDLSQQ